MDRILTVTDESGHDRPPIGVKEITRERISFVLAEVLLHLAEVAFDCETDRPSILRFGLQVPKDRILQRYTDRVEMAWVMHEEAMAYVPGHITGFFSVHHDEDPTKAGSRGAGLTLTDGVSTTVRPSSEVAVFLGEQRVTVEPVSAVLDTLEVTAHVHFESDLPLGAGFGVSGAMALGTALAANHVFERKLSVNELVTIAHGAEVEAGTGLGDVVAQAHGGMPIRLEPGAPGHNFLDSIPDRSRVEYVSFGEVSTSDVITGDTQRLNEAGTRALSHVVSKPTSSSFIFASRRFAREAGLLTSSVREALEDVTTVDGHASMAMLGDTVFALGTGLSDAGYEPAVCEVHPAGATME